MSQVEQIENVKIEYTGDLLSFKNEYFKATCQRKHFAVILTFDRNTTLYYPRKNPNSIFAKVHTVSSLFFLKGKYANCMYDENDTPEKACYIPKGKKSRGYYLDMFSLVSAEIIDAKVDYGNKWQAIADSMRKHNINSAVIESIEAHLKGEKEYIEGFQNYYTRYDKPRIANFKDVTREESIEDFKRQVTPSSYTEGVKCFDRRINGKKRDRSIALSMRDDGTFVSYTAASEYSGCGNGDYYMMYSPTMAFYAETD